MQFIGTYLLVVGDGRFACAVAADTCLQSVTPIFMGTHDVNDAGALLSPYDIHVFGFANLDRHIAYSSAYAIGAFLVVLRATQLSVLDGVTHCNPSQFGLLLVSSRSPFCVLRVMVL
jgi:hypothetical protein